jgi:predicted nucleic acid-binding protein
MPAALLDTNAVSDLMRDDQKVKARVGSHPDPVATSVVVVGEICFGLSRLPAGKKRRELEVRAQTILAILAMEPVTDVTLAYLASITRRFAATSSALRGRSSGFLASSHITRSDSPCGTSTRSSAGGRG